MTTRKNLRKEKKDIRLQLVGNDLERWEDILREKNITQNDALMGMLRTLFHVDDIARSVLMGQVKPTDELIAAALVQIQKSGKSERPAGMLSHNTVKDVK